MAAEMPAERRPAVLAGAPSLHVRVATLGAAMALHVAAVVLIHALAPTPNIPEADAVPIEIVLLPQAETQVASDAPDQAEANEPEPVQTAAAPAEPPAPPVESSPTPVEPKPDEAPLGLDAQKVQLPPPPRPRPRREDPVPARTPESPPTSQPRIAESSVANATPPPSTVAVVPGPAAKVASHADDAYVGRLVAWLDRYKEYPRAARLRRIEGTAVVHLSILEDGRIASATLVKSSGHPALDESTLDMVRRATPVPRPPAGALDLHVPVVFARGAY
jgi:periplasmic protein TonB